MEFGIGRSALLKVLAMAMDVPESGASAFLGRFQHLQRLRLVQGINPGRGKQAQYRANHVVVIAIALQLLQLGLTPERAVKIITENKDRVRLALMLAMPSDGMPQPSVLYFDPALLTRLGDVDPDDDQAEGTFHYAGAGTLMEMIQDSLIRFDVPRLAIVSVMGTIQALTGAMIELANPDGEHHSGGAHDRALADSFAKSLHEWVRHSTPDSLE